MALTSRSRHGSFIPPRLNVGGSRSTHGLARPSSRHATTTNFRARSSRHCSKEWRCPSISRFSCAFSSSSDACWRAWQSQATQLYGKWIFCGRCG
uniref:Uncharacterized protein n=1 Tax=Zea mays TaxID=4577 RepID=B4FDM0_MAIZE|nr:unknown [Zea mays]|eukprot:NP_001131693.1 uncharacterized protein LOC100193053 [Zea mays]